MHQKGTKKMNQEKVTALNALGFKWRVRNHRGSRRPNKPKPKEKVEESSEEEEDEDEDEEEEEEEDKEEDEGYNTGGGGHLHVRPSVRKTQKAASPGSSNQCSTCFSAILFPSAKCGGCQKGFCQDCFDEILHCNNQTCSSCKGHVNPTTAGWAL